MKRCITSFFACLFLVASSAQISLAAHDGNYWDKGRAYSAKLGQMKTDGNTFVISATALFDPFTPNTGGASGEVGRERIRG